MPSGLGGGFILSLVGKAGTGERRLKASELRGRVVLTLSDAAKVGHVDDVLLDATYRTVLGFRIKKGAFSQTEAVLRSNVAAVGRDAVTVSSPDVINMQDRLEELSGASALAVAQRTKVVTEGGELLGTISDVEIDAEALSVTSYVLDASLWQRLRHQEPTFGAQHVVKLGEGGIMIVANAVAESLRPAKS